MHFKFRVQPESDYQVLEETKMNPCYTSNKLLHLCKVWCLDVEDLLCLMDGTKNPIESMLQTEVQTIFYNYLHWGHFVTKFFASVDNDTTTIYHLSLQGFSHGSVTKDFRFKRDK